MPSSAPYIKNNRCCNEPSCLACVQHDMYNGICLLTEDSAVAGSLYPVCRQVPSAPPKHHTRCPAGHTTASSGGSWSAVDS